MPDTKPYISFNEYGVCAACQASRRKVDIVNGIDWDKRANEFDKIVLHARSKQAPFYDVLVPVSGGKDSITQVHRLLKYHLRILAVNVDYGIKTDIGKYNLECIPRNMGVNLQIYRPNLALHKKLIRIGFEEYGDPDLLSHTMLHGYPLRVALAYQIPLVVLGENSAFEYGGEQSISKLNSINREWFLKYAANSGKDAAYVSKKYDIPMNDLVMYDFPDELENSGTKTVFSSFYFFWDSEKHLQIAKKYGFQELDSPREGTYRTYVGIDEKINRIHQYFKVLKFGYGRATDHACEDIRNGKISRDEAKKLVKQYDLDPVSDEYVNDFCNFIDISVDRFLEVQDSFRNLSIWEQNSWGDWYIPGHLEDDI